MTVEGGGTLLFLFVCDEFLFTYENVLSMSTVQDDYGTFRGCAVKRSSFSTKTAAKVHGQFTATPPLLSNVALDQITQRQ